ncbi:hypothetical protein BKA67DRAFT_531515 [Truncatella angustata]|uniref:Uncharacterized protein n=1 Tax=Truncatella angustata TaxID=152316 RepID=A0A9P8UQ89_9PEZI|nr:uncharacterized protein BKA67DRAFT_531515 [Truncatella angustata]KAH6656229.1 hypothetical protein BKA67DRAFT_531515 [Truncatella angustata]
MDFARVISMDPVGGTLVESIRTTAQQRRFRLLFGLYPASMQGHPYKIPLPEITQSRQPRGPNTGLEIVVHAKAATHLASVAKRIIPITNLLAWGRPLRVSKHDAKSVMRDKAAWDETPARPVSQASAEKEPLVRVVEGFQKAGKWISLPDPDCDELTQVPTDNRWSN